MKVYIFILLFLFSCKEPNVFIQENYVISEVHYETVDKCRGIDVSEDVLVAAATHNGYMRYNIMQTQLLVFYSTGKNSKKIKNK